MKRDLCQDSSYDYISQPISTKHRLLAAGHAPRQPLHIWKSLPWTLEGSRKAKGHESMTESPKGEKSQHHQQCRT